MNIYSLPDRNDNGRAVDCWYEGSLMETPYYNRVVVHITYIEVYFEKLSFEGTYYLDMNGTISTGVYRQRSPLEELENSRPIERPPQWVSDYMMMKEMI